MTKDRITAAVHLEPAVENPAGDEDAAGTGTWAAMTKVAELLGVGTPETVRKWCRQAEVGGPGDPRTIGELAQDPPQRRGATLLPRGEGRHGCRARPHTRGMCRATSPGAKL